MKLSGTKSKLLSSLMILALCVTMFAGSTYAWFTDEVTSAGNKIQSGTLEMDLKVLNDEGNEWTSIKEDESPLFTYDKWEPGYTDVTILKVENIGNLALKWGAKFVSTNELGILKEVIDVYVKPGAEAYPADRSLEGYQHVGTVADFVNTIETTTYGALEAGQSATLGIALKMQESADNRYQNQELGPFDILIEATQKDFESDSFDNTYDAIIPNIDWYNPEDAEIELASVEELAGLATIINGTATASAATYAADSVVTIHDDFDGKTVKLNADVDLKNADWIPIGKIGASTTDFTYAFKGTFDGQGHTVSNLKVSNTGWAGLFGIAHEATIQNVNIKGVTIDSNRMAGAVVGQIYGSIYNCSVEDAVITVVPNAVGDGYDNGDKVGGIVGWLGDNGNNRYLKDCSAKNVTIKAYRDIGGIAGYIASSTNVIGNAVENIDITVDQITNYYGKKDENASKIVGRKGGTLGEVSGNSGAAKVSIETIIDKGTALYESSTKKNIPVEVKLMNDLNTSDSEKHYSGNREYAITGAGTEYTLDLNGKTINHDGTYQDGKNTGYTYLYTTAYDGKLIINGEGTINSANSEGNACIIYAQGPSEVVINGGNFNVDKGIAVWAGNNSKVTINGGSFISTRSGGNEELIYSSGGVIDIYGGFFHNEEWEGRPVNVADANRNTGFINIYGGTFVNFDPSTGGNDPNNIKVAEGYTVVAETQENGDIWYSVVAE